MSNAVRNQNESIRPSSWKEVFSIWEESEQGIYDDLYTSRGFSSWKDFRLSYFDNIPIESLDWKIHSIDNKDIPQIQCGAYPSWEPHFTKAGSRSMEALSKLEHFSPEKHHVIPQIRQAIESGKLNKIFLIGLVKNNQIFLLEGHHRSTVIAQLITEGKLPPLEIEIALAEVDPNQEYNIVDLVPPRHQINKTAPKD